MSCESTGGWGAAEARRRRDARYNIRSVRDATEDGHAGRLQGWPERLPTQKLDVTMSADQARYEPGNQYSTDLRISVEGGQRYEFGRPWTSENSSENYVAASHRYSNLTQLAHNLRQN